MTLQALKAQCAVGTHWPGQYERGYWQPPRWLLHDTATLTVYTKRVYMIDGGWYRANIDNKFDGGGNHGAYPEYTAR